VIQVHGDTLSAQRLRHSSTAGNAFFLYQGSEGKRVYSVVRTQLRGFICLWFPCWNLAFRCYRIYLVCLLLQEIFEPQDREIRSLDVTTLHGWSVASSFTLRNGDTSAASITITITIATPYIANLCS
jgi:hypothetical protein